MTSGENTGKKKQLIGSLARGLTTLDILMERNAVSVTELGQILGINKSNAYRLLITLENQGYADKDSSSGKYKLGMKLSKHMRVLDDVELRTFAHPYLEKLTGRTKESSGLCVLSSNEGVLIDKQSSSEKITANLILGMKEPLYCTSLGKAILGFLPEKEQIRIINAIDMIPLTPKTITNIDQLKADLKRTVLLGVAVDDEEYSLGMRCISAPIFDEKGECIASMGISGPITRIRTDKLDEYIAIVKEITTEMSRQLGWTGTNGQ